MTVRLMDFGSPNPFVGIFGRPRTLAWPVNTYRVTLPMSGRGSNTLNPFEQVILGVLEAEPGRNLSDLAQVTCIPEGLVRSVLLRLRDRRLIDNDNRPPQQASTANPEDSEVQIVTAVVFQEALTGRLLPHIQILDEDSPLRFKTREDLKYYQGRVIRASGRPKSHAHPSPKDVIAVLRESRQRSAAFGGRAKLPELSQIRVADDADSHLLECPIAIQRSDADFRIADPFGSGFSLMLEEVLTARLAGDESLQQWMTDWRTSLTSTESGDSSSRDRTRQPFEAEPFRSRYPRLVTSLVAGRTRGYRSIAKIYASLEWALFYCADTRDAANAIEVVRHTRPDEWSEHLSRAAEQIGLKVPAYGFRAIPHGRLADMLAGKAEMSTVLAATLVQAEHDEAHPLRKLAERHPGFLLRIQEIRESRDEQEHGGAAERQDGESRFDALMCEWVTALIPGIRFDGPALGTGHQATAEDRRLDARTAVIGQLGYALMNRLPGSARDALIDAERAWIAHYDSDDALPLVGRLYAALQSVTMDRLSGLQAVALPAQDYRNVATSRAEVAGFGRIPEALSRVRPERVREAMFGNGSTLGACAIALLLVLSDEQLVKLAAVQPSLMADIGAVISHRGHGNESVPLNKSATKSLRTSAINSIRTLMEA